MVSVPQRNSGSILLGCGMSTVCGISKNRNIRVNVFLRPHIPNKNFSNFRLALCHIYELPPLPYTTYNDFRYSNKPYAEHVGQCMSYI